MGSPPLSFTLESELKSITEMSDQSVVYMVAEQEGIVIEIEIESFFFVFSTDRPPRLIDSECALEDVRRIAFICNPTSPRWRRPFHTKP